MAIADSFCFQRDDTILRIPILTPDNSTEIEVFVLDGNVSVEFYYRFIVAHNKIKKAMIAEDDDTLTDLLKDLAVDVLNTDRTKTITAYDFETKFSNIRLLSQLYGWASDVCSKLSEMVNNSDLFSIPNIQISNAPSPTAAERALQKMDTDIELMEGIVFVSQHTHNSFSDVMKMPYLVFQSHLKHIHLSQLLENKEWREKYLQAKYEIESKKPENQSLSRNKKNPDMDGLMRLGGLING